MIAREESVNRPLGMAARLDAHCCIAHPVARNQYAEGSSAFSPTAKQARKETAWIVLEEKILFTGGFFIF